MARNHADPRAPAEELARARVVAPDLHERQPQAAQDLDEEPDADHLTCGGVSYAAGVLPKGSVGTAQLKKKAVTGAKLQKNASRGST